MQIKTTMKYFYTPLRTAKSKGEKTGNSKSEHRHRARGTPKHVRWTSHFEKQSHSFLYIKLYIFLPYDPEIPLSGVYPSEMKADVHAEM